MKKILLLCLFAGNVLLTEATPIKVACIGNSITFGAGIDQREKQSYPAQLQTLLGPEYEVKNFGVNSSTLMSSGDTPYIQTGEYRNSLAFEPDVVVIKLGTNDSKSFNADKLERDYYADYQKLIESYRSLPSQPRILLCTPVRCYISGGVFKEANTHYEGLIIPTIEQLAYENQLEVIDLYHLFSDTHNETIFPDRLHPSAIGANQMSRRIADIIELDTTAPKMALPTDHLFNFHGYQGYAWENGNKIVAPRRAAPGNPWVLRARFWGHQPQTDMALLERGFHIAYCNVEGLFGAPEAVKRYNTFYQDMTALGLNKQVVLEAMSRGGLIAYNWAAKNASKVAAIYADAPVLDIKSWPMQWGGEEDRKEMFAAYGFKDQKAANSWKKNPIDQTRTLTSIPILHVVGDADKVVPTSENTTPFELKLKEMGGNITVIHKPEVGHHPHSLFAPTPIVDFILRNTKLYKNKATTPIHSNEFRSAAAGWGSYSWSEIDEEISALLAQKEVDYLLLGNSITQGFGGSRQRIDGVGKSALDKYLTRWESAGISGDCTQHLLWRLQHSNYGVCRPKTVFITIGVNNIDYGDTPQEIAEGIVAVTRQAEATFPTSKIILFGILPVDRTPQEARREIYNKVHSLLLKSSFSPHTYYVSPHNTFVNNDGNLKVELYTPDMLHLNQAGYAAWATLINQHK